MEKQISLQDTIKPKLLRLDCKSKVACAVRGTIAGPWCVGSGKKCYKGLQGEKAALEECLQSATF